MGKFIKTYSVIQTPNGVGHTGMKCNFYYKVVRFDSAIQQIAAITDVVKRYGIDADNKYTTKIDLVEGTIIFDDNTSVRYGIKVMVSYYYSELSVETINLYTPYTNDTYMLFNKDESKNTKDK